MCKVVKYLKTIMLLVAIIKSTDGSESYSVHLQCIGQRYCNHRDDYVEKNTQRAIMT